MTKHLFSLLTIVFVTIITSSCKKDKTPEDPETAIETTPATVVPHTVAINANIPGYYSAEPGYYSRAKKKYPLIISLHGGGQFGNGSTQLVYVLYDGIPKLLADKKFPPAFTISNQTYSFLVLAPQFKQAPTTADLQQFINYAFANYRIDSSRIYITGLSLGGSASCEIAAVTPLPAAIIPMAGALQTTTQNYAQKAKAIANNNTAVWAFHNQNDFITSATETATFVTTVNANQPVTPARYTQFNGSSQHDCWTKATDPGYKEGGKNIYEWMLQYKR